MIKIINVRLVILLMFTTIFHQVVSLNSLAKNYSQDQKNGEVDEVLLEHLRLHLFERADQFGEYQKAEEWRKVSEYLGDFYFDFGWKRIKYTEQQKQWMVNKLRSKPLMNFIPEKIHHISSNNGLPLDERYWMVIGTANYLENQKVISKRFGLAAYLYQGEFFFSPLEIDQSAIKLIIPPMFFETLK
jgi:hypothetical protein